MRLSWIIPVGPKKSQGSSEWKEGTTREGQHDEMWGLNNLLLLALETEEEAMSQGTQAASDS